MWFYFAIQYPSLEAAEAGRTRLWDAIEEGGRATYGIVFHRLFIAVTAGELETLRKVVNNGAKGVVTFADLLTMNECLYRG